MSASSNLGVVDIDVPAVHPASMPAPKRFGPFLIVEAHNGVSLDFHDTDGEIASQRSASASEGGRDRHAPRSRPPHIFARG